MKTQKRKIDYTKIFSDSKLSRQVIHALEKSDRKMRYMEHDLKVEQPKKEQKEPGAKMQPAREDSFDRLLGEGHSFNGSVEKQLFQKNRKTIKNFDNMI